MKKKKIDASNLQFKQGVCTYETKKQLEQIYEKLIPKTINKFKIKPLNLFTKLLMPFLRLTIVSEEIPNPIYKEINTEVNTFGVLPKKPWIKSGFTITAEKDQPIKFKNGGRR